MKALNLEGTPIDPAQLKELLTPKEDPGPGIEFDMEALVQRGQLEREVEPIKGLKITMHTLKHSERKVLANEINLQGKTDLATFEELKVPTLQFAITAMGKKEYITPEQKKELREALDAAPGMMVDLIFAAYQKLVTDQLDLFEQGVKKNS